MIRGAETPSAPMDAQASSELREFLHSRNERKRLFPRAFLVGTAAGLVAVAFRACLSGADVWRTRLLMWCQTHPMLGWPIAFAMGAAGAIAAVWMVRRWAPEASGSGIPNLEAVLHRHRTMRWWPLLPVKFAGGVVGIGAGMTLGREGPTVQMGGAVGLGLAKLMKVSSRESLILIAAGSGAGLAAAFNAPLAGLIFVLEELQRDFRPTVFGATFLASAAAAIVSRLFSGQVPSFVVPAYPSAPLVQLPIFVALGVLAAFLGVAYNRSLLGSLNLFSKLTGKRRVAACALVGGAIGLVGLVAPLWIGGGHGLAELTLKGGVVLSMIPLLFALRFVMLMASYGTGAPGGIFAPLLVLGALLGLAVGLLAKAAFPWAEVLPGTFAVVGMAAYFTAIVRAPLTGIVLIVEMTSSYAQMLALLVACFAAYITAEAMGDLPIYEALLQRDLLKGGSEGAFHEPIVLELEVEPGAPFEGKALRSLGLPSGVVLVSLREGDHEWVPTADTVLTPHVRISAVVSPDAPKGLEALRRGCEG